MADNYLRGIVRADLYNKLVLHLVIIILTIINMAIFYCKFI